MPATLSAIPPELTADAGARLLHAAQVVVPSAICAPHMLQNAMESSSSDQSNFAGTVRKVSETQMRSKILNAEHEHHVGSPVYPKCKPLIRSGRRYAPALGGDANCSANSPSTGSLKASPCAALTISTSQTTTAASPITIESNTTKRRPSTGMMSRTYPSNFTVIPMMKIVAHKKRHWNE